MAEESRGVRAGAVPRWPPKAPSWPSPAGRSLPAAKPGGGLTRREQHRLPHPDSSRKTFRCPHPGKEHSHHHPLQHKGMSHSRRLASHRGRRVSPIHRAKAKHVGIHLPSGPGGSLSTPALQPAPALIGPGQTPGNEKTKHKKQLGNGLQPGNLRQQIPKLKTSKIQIQGKKTKTKQKNTTTNHQKNGRFSQQLAALALQD